MLRSHAVFIAIASSVLSSLGWIFQDRAVDALGPMTVVSAQGILVGALYLLRCGSVQHRLTWSELRAHRRDFIELTLLRGVIGGTLICYALLLSGSIKVMFFTKLEPYLVLFWGWLLAKQTISRSHAGLLAVHVAGAILLSTGGNFSLAESQQGDLLLVMAVALSSYTYLHAGRLSREFGAAQVNGITSLATGIITLPAALILAPDSIWSYQAIGWSDLLILVVLFNVFALTMWFAALKYLETWLVSALRAVGPVVAAPVAWMFFDQNLSALQILGAALVVTTSALLVKARAAGGKGREDTSPAAV